MSERFKDLYGVYVVSNCPYNSNNPNRRFLVALPCQPEKPRLIDVASKIGYRLIAGRDPETEQINHIKCWLPRELKYFVDATISLAPRMQTDLYMDAHRRILYANNYQRQSNIKQFDLTFNDKYPSRYPTDQRYDPSTGGNVTMPECVGKLGTVTCGRSKQCPQNYGRMLPKGPVALQVNTNGEYIVLDGQGLRGFVMCRNDGGIIFGENEVFVINTPKTRSIQVYR